MADKKISKVTRVDSQIPKMKDVDYKLDRMNNVYQIRKKSKERKKEEATLNELARDVVEMIEDVEYGDVVGSAVSAEQPNYSRMTGQAVPPQYVAASGDRVRNVSDSLTNMTGSTKLAANMDAEKNTFDEDEFGFDEDDEFGSGQDSDSVAVHSGANPRGLVRPDKYITDYRGDGLDYGATHSESFTGTAAIALAPIAFGADTRQSNKKSKKKTKLETAMNRKRLVREYTPDFAAGSYKPGDPKMNKKGGKSVQSPALNNVGQFYTKDELTTHGEWPRKHKANLAMSNVDEDGVDGESAGSHDSSAGTPEDGIQTKMGHNWPNRPKNRGGQTAMKGSRYADGGVLGRSVDESWSPTRIGQMMGEGINLQSLFDQYARSVGKVTTEGFLALCEAYGQPAALNRDTMLELMDRNRDFIFYEDEDSDGSYWVPDDDIDVDDDMDAGMDDDMDMDMDDDLGDDLPSDEDGVLTSDEHEDVHARLKEFCAKYGCPEDELHDLCHEYAQAPMDDLDADEFGDDEFDDECVGDECQLDGDDEFEDGDEFDDGGMDDGDEFEDDDYGSTNECHNESKVRRVKSGPQSKFRRRK